MYNTHNYPFNGRERIHHGVLAKSITAVEVVHKLLLIIDKDIDKG